MEEKYIRQISKKLKCSKEKREEIRRQLESDMHAEIEGGETAVDVMKRMGSPAEVAAEFNSNLSDVEKKKYRKEKWTKRIVAIVLILACMAALIYWAVPKNVSLENNKFFSEEKLEATSEQVVLLLDEKDYDALADMAIEKVGSLLNEETLQPARDSISDDWGSFQSFGNIYMSGVSQMGKQMAVVQLNVSYENTSVTYTLSFDQDMKLTGLWMK